MIIDKTAYVISLVQVLAGASFLLILLPLYVWRNYLKNKSYAFRFVFVVLVQNSLLINLVLLLGFLGICNRLTVLLGMAAVYIPLGWHFSDKQFFCGWQKRLDGLLQMAYGQKHFFTLRQEIGRWFAMTRHQIRAWPFWRHLKKNLPEYLFLTGAVAYNIWFLSHNVLEFHTFQFSDIPVHQSWVYALSQGRLFVDGIYPFGMHAIVYLIHGFFFIDLRETLLYFGVFQTVLLLLCLHLLARTLFRWQFGAIAVTICFSLLLNQGRYAAALPQECGVFALVLAGWCLVRFFRRPLTRDKDKHRPESDSQLRRASRFKQGLNRRCLTSELLLFIQAAARNQRLRLQNSALTTDLLLFMLATALTIAYHFYTAIAAGILVLAFFAAYSFKMVKKQYWVPLITAGLLGVFLAVSPLMASYAKGIPFQESMEWAMSVIRGEKWEGSEPDYQQQLEGSRVESNQTDRSRDESSLAEDNLNESSWDESNQGGRGQERKVEEMPGTGPDMTNRSFSEKLRFYYNGVYNFSRIAMFGDELTDILMICLGLGAVFGGVLLFFQPTRLTGAGYLAMLCYVVIIGIMGAAQELGIPEIIGPARAMTFAEPFLGIVYVIPLDFAFLLLSYYKDPLYRRILVFISVALCLGMTYAIFHRGWVHDFFEVNPAYYNEADYLVKKIRTTFKPETFTIVSPVEEYYQVIGYGYHENLSKFVNMAIGQSAEYKIPTPYVFFFIEKQVLDDYYYGSAKVSREYAEKDFVYFASSQDYYFQRAVLESKAYYWAQDFQKVYPNSFKVYFENKIFIVYMLEQNPYSLYNFQIYRLTKGAEAE